MLPGAGARRPNKPMGRTSLLRKLVAIFAAVPVADLFWYLRQ